MATKHQIPVLAGAIVSKQGGLEALSAKDIQWAIENPTLAVSFLVTAIQGRHPLAVIPLHKRRLWTPWKTISLGGISRTELDASVDGVSVNSAKNLMYFSDFGVAEMKENAALIILTPRDLGFTYPPGIGDIMTTQFCKDWSEKYLVDIGYSIELCQPEVALKLCRQCEGRTKGEKLWIATEFIVDKDVVVDHLFYIYADTGPEEKYWLHAHSVFSDKFELDSPIVFRLCSVTAQ